MKTDGYEFSIMQCDVPVERRGALESFRGKRRVWRSWIDTDDHHAIWPALSSMIWTEVSFKVLTDLAINDEQSPLNNSLLGEALIHGQVATQVLAIRRLVDDGNSDIISLRRLVKDVRRHFGLFTRENYICFDGLPYDYEAVQYKEMMEFAGKGTFWAATTGPSAHSTSRMAHEQFDRLAGIDPAKRSRQDCLPISLITTIERWLAESDADELAKWSSTYLAHAGGPESRNRIAALTVTANKITHAIKALSRVTEALSAFILLAGGRSGSLMPVAQFDPFEKLDRPVMPKGSEAGTGQLWQRLSADWDRHLDDVEDELIRPVGHPAHTSDPTTGT